MFIRSLVLAIFALSLSACNITGSGQKGPFITGSNVSASQLNNQAAPIASSTITTQVTDNQGRYSIDEIPWDGWTEIQVSGHYFNEFTNTNSNENLSLRTITKKNQRFDTANVHLFSHLAAARIKQHVANGDNRNNAWKKAQTELKQLFGLINVSQNIDRGVEQLSLTRGSGQYREDNANLLLFTGSFLANGGNAASLQELSEDFADDAQFNGIGAAMFNAIALTGSTAGLLETLSQNLKSHGAFNPPNNGDLPQLPIWVIDDHGEVDTIPPVITLLGDASVNVIQGATYDDAGATASDNPDGDITANIVIDNPVDTNAEPGTTFTITYNVSDSATPTPNVALEVTRTVTIIAAPDTSPPVITLIGNASVNVIQGSIYADAGATALDDPDGDITTNIVIVNPVDTNTEPGTTFTITYNVSDSATPTPNAAVEVTRTVTIIAAPDTSPPVITLIGNASVNVIQGSTYADAGATALDDPDGDITTNIVIVNPVDTNAELGTTFTITYNVSDSATPTANAAVEVTRTVVIIDSPPVATDMSVSGLITLANGTPVNGAEIIVYKDNILQVLPPITSDAQGNYTLTLDLNSNYTLVVDHDGYATQVQNVETQNLSEITKNFILVEDGVTVEFNRDRNFTGTGNYGTSVTLTSNVLDGNASDAIELSITPLNISTEAGYSAQPGSAMVQLTGQATPTPLYALGMAEFTFTNVNTGNLVNLINGQTATITIPLFHLAREDGTPYTAGDTIPLLYLDETSGIWKQENNTVATVVASTYSPTGLAATATVTHFSWWSVGFNIPPASSYSAYANIRVEAGGQTGTATIKASTNADVSYTPEISTLPIGETVNISFPGWSNTTTCFWAEILINAVVVVTPEQCITPITGTTYDLIFTTNTNPFDINTQTGLNSLLGEVAAQKRLIPYTSESFVSYTITSGTLPAGITLSKINDFSAIISGTPTQAGTFNSEITAVDSDNNSKVISFEYVVIDSTTTPAFVIGNGPGNMPTTFAGFETGYLHHCGYACVDINATGFSSFTLDLSTLNIGANATSWEIIDPVWYRDDDSVGQVYVERTDHIKEYTLASNEGITISNSGILTINRPASSIYLSHFLRIWAKNSQSPASIPHIPELSLQRPDVLHVFLTFDPISGQYKDYWTY